MRRTDAVALLRAVVLTLALSAALLPAAGPTASAGWSVTASAQTGSQMPAQLRAEPRRARVGTAVTLRGRLPAAARHRVRLQRHVDGRWVTRSSEVAGRQGRFSFRATLPRTAGVVRYRVVGQAVRGAAAPSTPVVPVTALAWRADTPAPTGPTWVSIDTAGGTTCGVRTDRTGWCWGENSLGQVGDGTLVDRPLPLQVAGEWQVLSVARSTVCGLRTDNRIWCWGNNNRGQLGIAKNPATDPYWATPTQVSFQWDWFTQTDDGTQTCGIRIDRSAWCWGGNEHGQVGEGSILDRRIPHEILIYRDQVVPDPAQNPPYPNAGAARFRYLSPGPTACGVLIDGTGWCWGDDASGQVGDADSTVGHNTRDLNGDSIPPTSDVVFARQVAVTFGTGSPWISLSSGGGTTCGIGPDHALWCWGRNDRGAVGDGSGTNQTVPVQVPGSWAAIDNEGATKCATRTDATGWCWGDDTRGQVGDGTVANQLTPFQLPGTWNQLDVGSDGADSCGTRTDTVGATAWCWGANAYGQLGDGTRTLRRVPTQVPGAWSAVRLDEGTACGVRPDGTAACWGRNDTAQVGDGTLVDKLVPTDLPYRVRSVWSLGGNGTTGGTTCGLVESGQAVCWGANGSGQVGDGSTATRPAPYVVQ